MLIRTNGLSRDHVPAADEAQNCADRNQARAQTDIPPNRSHQRFEPGLIRHRNHAGGAHPLGDRRGALREAARRAQHRLVGAAASERWNALAPAVQDALRTEAATKKEVAAEQQAVRAGALPTQTPLERSEDWPMSMLCIYSCTVI